MVSKERERIFNTHRRLKIRKQVLGHYSQGVPHCKRCGISDMRVLTIDHINSGGCQHLKQIGVSGGKQFYHWLKKNNYPDGFQVLCMNCQFIKRLEQRESSLRFENKQQLKLIEKTS